MFGDGLKPILRAKWHDSRTVLQAVHCHGDLKSPQYVQIAEKIGLFSRCSGMGVLWEVEGQYEGFSSRVLDFDTTVG